MVGYLCPVRQFFSPQSHISVSLTSSMFRILLIRMVCATAINLEVLDIVQTRIRNFIGPGLPFGFGNIPTTVQLTPFAFSIETVMVICSVNISAVVLSGLIPIWVTSREFLNEPFI